MKSLELRVFPADLIKKKAWRAAMAKRKKKSPEPPAPTVEIPPGATRHAWDRPIDPGGGLPGSAAGGRHAADDEGTENETIGRMDTTTTPASPLRNEDHPPQAEKPYVERMSELLAEVPPHLRSLVGQAFELSLEDKDGTHEPTYEPARIPPPSESRAMRLTGYAAIEYAEKQGLLLNKHPDAVTGPRVGLTVAEAEAIAEEDSDLIWLNVAEEEYYTGPITSYEPGR
jgi:hypothetical protein